MVNIQGCDIAVIILAVVLIYKEFIAYRERVLIEKIRKAKDINEVLALDIKPEKEVESDEEIIDVADVANLDVKRNE